MRDQLLGFSLFVVIVAAVTIRAATATAHPPFTPATDEQRRTFARAAAASEPDWQRKAVESFPYDNWSTRDAFQNHEMQGVQNLSGGKVPLEDVYRAIDEDIHAQGRIRPTTDRNADAVPCKPRPIFE